MAESDQRTSCKECNHSKSFHGKGATRCRALGCDCQRWVEPEAKKKAVAV